MTDPTPKPAPVPLALTPAQQRIVLDNQAFAVKATTFYALKYRGALAKDDVRQLVHLAMSEAARIFDPTRGISFASFVWLRVGGALVDAAERATVKRDPLWRAMAACLALEDGEVRLDEDAAGIAARVQEVVSRVATAAVMGAMGVATAATEDAEPAAATSAARRQNPETALLEAELRGTVETEVARLPERGRRVVELYYGEGKTLRDVAEVLGVSYATVRRDHEEALVVLRDGCIRAGFEGPE